MILALALSTGLFAQAKKDDKMKMDMGKDHLMMMDEKMQIEKNGKSMVMVKDVTVQ